MRFTWDPHKAMTNATKHNVLFKEAVTVFADPLALVLSDEEHPERGVVLGESLQRRILFVVFIETEDDMVRLISARRATQHERRYYENKG